MRPPSGSSAGRITDSDGAEVARYAYDPYGNPLVSQAPGTLAERNPLRYRGYCYDAESGYYHMPARYYDPASARFVSVDPAAPSAGDPVSLNGYSYCFAYIAYSATACRPIALECSGRRHPSEDSNLLA